MRGWVTLGAALFAVTGCGSARSLVRQPDPAREGAAAYRRACASCHGTGARGDGPVAPTLRVPPPDLTTLSARHGGRFPREWVIDVISGEREITAHGTREMPVWSDRFGRGSSAANVASFYARRRLELLADHLESLQRPE